MSASGRESNPSARYVLAIIESPTSGDTVPISMLVVRQWTPESDGQVDGNGTPSSINDPMAINVRTMANLRYRDHPLNFLIA